MSIDVGVGQLVQELEQRGDRLPFEIGAFVALEACEGLLQESVKLEADDVRVTAEGSVVVAPSAVRAEPDVAARSLVSVLSRLLVAAGPGVPPYLLQLVREGASEGAPRDLRHLHDAIEASLIPLNRGASRRVLARLVRESDRPPAPEETAIDPSELDAELDELLADPSARSLDTADVADEPITAKITMPRRSATPTATVESEPGAAEPEATTEPEAAVETEASVESEVVVEPEPIAEPEAATVPPPLPTAATQGTVVVSEQVKVDSAPPPSQLAVAAATKPAPASTPPEEAVTATIRVRFPEPEPQTAKIPLTDEPAPTLAADEEVSRATKRPVAEAAIQSATATTQQWAIEPPADADAPRESAVSVPSAAPEVPASATPSSVPSAPRKVAWAPWLLALAVVGVVGVLIADGGLRGVENSAVAPAAPTVGTIALTVDPPDSQVFVFVGRGPAIARGLAPGAAHEFVVFDRGLDPSRTMVPANATWETTDDGLRYELAVQAQPLQTDDRGLDLGLPLSEPTKAEAATGYVRVVTNPPGAKVYRFVGTGPSVAIPVSSIHEGHELLIFHPDRAPQRAVIGPSDWRPGSGAAADHRAELEATLPPRASEGVADSRDD